jgi:hypothetical protein
MRVKTEPPTQIPPDLVKTIEEIGREMGIEEVTVSTFFTDEIPKMNNTYDFAGPVILIDPKEPKVKFEESLFSKDEVYKRGKIVNIMANLMQRKLGYQDVIEDAKVWVKEMATDERNLFMVRTFLDTVKGCSVDQIIIDHGYAKELYHMRRGLLEARENIFSSRKFEPQYSSIEEYLYALVPFYSWIPFSLCSKTEEANELRRIDKAQVREYIPIILSVYDTVGDIFLDCGNPLTQQKVKNSVKKFFDVYISLI